MAEVLKLEKPKVRGPDPGGFIRTETASDILRTFELVRAIDGAAISMVCGAPGIGKTKTLRHIAESHDDTIYLSVAKGEGNPAALATAIKALFSFGGVPQKDHRDLTARRIECGHLIGRRTLLVDEAQNLYQRNKAAATKGSGFGWLVALAEDTGGKLIFCGDMTLQAIMMEFPHLQSRMRRPVIRTAAARQDVQALASEHGFTTDDELRLLTKVAELPGGMRNVENVIRLASLFAGAARAEAGHLAAAVKDLKLDSIGGV